MAESLPLVHVIAMVRSKDGAVISVSLAFNNAPHLGPISMAAMQRVANASGHFGVVGLIEPPEEPNRCDWLITLQRPATPPQIIDSLVRAIGREFGFTAIFGETMTENDALNSYLENLLNSGNPGQWFTVDPDASEPTPKPEEPPTP